MTVRSTACVLPVLVPWLRSRVGVHGHRATRIHACTPLISHHGHVSSFGPGREPSLALLRAASALASRARACAAGLLYRGHGVMHKCVASTHRSIFRLRLVREKLRKSAELKFQRPNEDSLQLEFTTV